MPHTASAGPALGALHTAYARLERPLSSISLVGGFVFDAVTLKRVDSFWEMFWVGAHLGVVAVCILLLNREALGGPDTEKPGKASFWYINGLQFFFGGLLSTFLVLNFRSGSLWASWPFLLILAAAFVANERLKEQYKRFYFQLSIFFLSLYCTVILILPVILHSVGRLAFVASGVVTLLVMLVFLQVLRVVAGKRIDIDIDIGSRPLVAMLAGIFLVINALYFLNLIPPVPLSLRDAGVYHGVERQADGSFVVESEPAGLLGVFRYFRYAESFHFRPGAPIYAYTAIFSPAALDTTIVHHWELYDPARRRWMDMGRVALAVRGGRGEGYRTYSVKTGAPSGAWRVDVETRSGALLGRLRFNVVQQPEDPPLVPQIKN